MKTTPLAAWLLCTLLPGSAAAQEVDLSCTVRKLAQGVELRIGFEGGTDGSSHAMRPEMWGGQASERIELTAFGAGGRELTCARDDEGEGLAWSIAHRPAERIELVYRFAHNENQGQRETQYHIVQGGLVQFVGSLAWLLPARDMDQELSLSIEWVDFDDDWLTMTSFGPGPALECRATPAQIASSLWVAGPLRSYESDVGGVPVRVTLLGKTWGFSDQAFHQLATRIVELERGFFEDWERPYWINLLPIGEPLGPSSSSLGGTALHEGFALYMNPDAGMRGVRALLAHEMFHEWNGRQIQREQPEEEAAWFSEGFTCFYTRRLLYRGGLMDVIAFSEEINKVLSEFYGNPLREAPNQVIADGFWSSHDAQRLAYLRGDLVAALLDQAIRHEHEGKQNLDHVMRELLERARGGERFDNEALIKTFARYAGKEETWRALLIEGAPLKIPYELFGDCLVRATTVGHPYELGFDLEASRAAKRITGLASASRAARSGVREGDLLHNIQYREGEADHPVLLKLEREGIDGPFFLEYMPWGKSFEVPSFVPRPEARQGTMHCAEF